MKTWISLKFDPLKFFNFKSILQCILCKDPPWLLLLCPTSHAALSFSRSEKYIAEQSVETDSVPTDETQQVTSVWNKVIL